MYRQTDFMGTGAAACFYHFNVLVFSHFSLGNETQILTGCSKQQPCFSFGSSFYKLVRVFVRLYMQFLALWVARV